MSMSDPIADMLTRIRNAAAARKYAVCMPHSNLKSEIARILKREGFILDNTTEADAEQKSLRIFLKYGPDEDNVIKGLERVSRPGLRRYVGSGEVPRVLGGLGLAILSTSSGVVSDREARKQKIGGEVLCQVW